MKKTHVAFISFVMLFFSQTHGQTTLNLDYAQSLSTRNGGDDYGKALAVDAAGNTYVVGHSSAAIDLDPSPSATYWTAGASAFIAKYNPSGSFVWAKIFNGTLSPNSTITPNALVLDASNNIYVTGAFLGISDFDPGEGIQNLTGSFSENAFFAKFDQNGNYLFAKSVGEGGAANSKSIAIDASSNIYLAGNFNGTVDFDPDPVGTYTLTAPPWHDVILNMDYYKLDAFFAKYDANGIFQWAHSNGSTSVDDYGYSVAVAANNDVYVAGQVGAAYFAKYSSTGVLAWADTLFGTQAAYSIKVDALSNAYIAGTFAGTVDFDPDPNNSYPLTTFNSQDDGFFAKYDAFGKFVFAKQIDGTYCYVTPTQLALDPSGNILLTGMFLTVNVLDANTDFDPDPVTTYTLSSFNGQRDFFAAKYDPSGAFTWAFNWGTGASGNITNIGNDITSDLVGNVYITGAILKGTAAADFNPDPLVSDNFTSKVTSSLFVAKYDPDSKYSWGFISDEGDGGDDTPGKMAMDKQGNTYIVGSFLGTIDFDPGTATVNTLLASPYDKTDIVLAKYDARGNYLWAKKIGGSKNDLGLVIALDASNNIYIAGNFYGTVDFDPDPVNVHNLIGSSSYANMFLAKYDSDGNYLWANQFKAAVHHDITATSLVVDAANEVYLGGYFIGAGTTDMDPSGTINNIITDDMESFIAKYDNSGAWVWANKINSEANSSSQLNGLVTDVAGNCYAIGFFYGGLDFEPGSGAHILNATTGNPDIFLAKYDPSGVFTWVNQIPAAQANGIAIDPSGKIYLTGSFWGPSEFDPLGGHTLPVTGFSDIFFAKYDASGNYVMAKSLPGSSGISAGAGSSITVSAVGEILLTGNLTGTIDFDPEAGTQNLTDNGNGDLFIAKYDVLGNYMTAKSFGGTTAPLFTADFTTTIVSNAAGDTVCVFGAIAAPSPTIDFDPDLTVADTITPLSGTDMFFAKYSIGLPRPIELITVSDNNINCNLQCTGTATITATRGTWPYTYSWSPGGATTNALTSLCEGTYTLTITDAASLVSTATVSIEQPSPVKGHIEGSANVCSDKLTTLNAIGGNMFLWNTGETTNSISTTLSAPPGGRNWTSYTATYSLTISHNGICSDDTTFTITVTPTPTATISGAGSICSGSSLLLSAEGSATGGGNYLWSTQENTSEISASPLSTTTYSLIISTVASCGDTAWASIAVTTTPTAHISATKTILCSGDSAMLTRTGTADNYLWSNGLTTNTINATPATTRSFFLSLSNGTCSAQDSVMVEVVPMPTASISGASTVCSGNSTEITATGGNTYLWNTGEASASITKIPLSNMNYSVTVSNGNGLCQDTASQNITLITPIPTDAGPDVTMAIGLDTVISTNNGTAWNWAPLGRLNCYSCQSTIANPLQTTSYTVTVTDINGCITTDNITIFIIPCADLFIPNAFSPNNDGENDLLHIRGTDCIEKVFSFTIFNRWGEKIFETTDIKATWDGSQSAQTKSNEVFIYYLDALSITGDAISKTGNVTLLK